MALNKNNIFLLNLFWVHYVTQNFFLTFVIVLYFILDSRTSIRNKWLFIKVLSQLSS